MVSAYTRVAPTNLLCKNEYSHPISHFQAAVDSLIEENDRLKSQLVSVQGDGVSNHCCISDRRLRLAVEKLTLS